MIVDINVKAFKSVGVFFQESRHNYIHYVEKCVFLKKILKWSMYRPNKVAERVFMLKSQNFLELIGRITLYCYNFHHAWC